MAESLTAIGPRILIAGTLDALPWVVEGHVESGRFEVSAQWAVPSPPSLGEPFAPEGTYPLTIDAVTWNDQPTVVIDVGELQGGSWGLWVHPLDTDVWTHIPNVTGEADIGMGRPVLSAAGIVVVDGPEGGGTFRAVPNLVELRAGPDGWVPHEVPLPEGRSVDRAITVSADGQLLATETWRWPSGREVLLYERRAELELVHREPFAVNEVKLDGGRLWALDPEDVLWWTEPGSTTWEGLPVPTEQGHRLRGDGGRWMAVLGQPVTLLDRERPTLRGTFQSPGHAWFTDGAWVDGQLVLVHETRLFVLDPAASEGLEPVPTPPVRTRTALPPDPIVLPEPETKLEYEYARAVSPPGLGVYKGTYRSAQVLVFERHEVLRLAALQDNRWRTRCPEAVEYPDATLQLPPRDGDPTRSLQDQRLDIRHGAAHAYDLSGLLDVERWDDQRFEGKLDLTVSPASEGGSHGWLRGPVSAEIVDCRP